MIEPMVVRCITPARCTRPGVVSRITVGKTYEVLAIFGWRRTCYRVVNDIGDHSAYSAKLFETVSGEVKNPHLMHGKEIKLQTSRVQREPIVPVEPPPYCAKHFYTLVCPVCNPPSPVVKSKAWDMGIRRR